MQGLDAVMGRVHLLDADAEDEEDNDEQHDADQSQEEDATLRLGPAPLHRATEHAQHPVVDVDGDGDVHHAVQRRQRVAQHADLRAPIIQEAQLMLTTGSTRLAVSRGQQTWYHFRSIATFR